ncbi:uncharacterized protein LOC120788282 isoform X2 [Xiphias gladius]|uniref:uncharacterized protein LOC120788282 isoform X2 n=1 Tax=Xiphias gladius TaxID=8245 RepID=UPI001A98AF59|nr:uncharacterized protein LOC120788282 isoform X2 [Xiphias gladius]
MSHSSLLPVHDKYNVNAYIDQPDADERINIEKYSPDWIKNPLLSEYDNDDVKPVLDDRKRQSTPVTTAVQPLLPPNYTPDPDPVAAPRPKQPSFPTPSNHNHPPYPYYYHPYYHYYQMYYGPESLQNADNHMSPASSKEASDPLLQASSFPVQHPSYCKFQITTLPKESMYDDQNSCLHPYCYYYQLFYQPKVSKENQELPPAGSMDSEKASSKSESQLPSDSEYSGMDIQVHAAEAGHPSIPWPPHNPFHSFYSHYMTQQHQYDLIGHPGEEAEEMLDYEMTVSDSVMEPTVAPSAHSSENSNVSCTVQWLNSHPDIYIVPLDGCGVNKHVFGQTVVHLLEVHNSVHENSPVRLMVDCSSFPGSLGELRLHLIDQPSPSPIQSRPATVNVQLRIATDESFTSYHPEAHLPLSLMRGRPLYLEVSLLDSTEPNLVLLVHSCLAYTQAQYTSWMPIYDGCPSRVESQLLPSLRSDSHHIRRVLISSFLSLPSESPTYMAKGGYSLLEDPEIYVLCLTEVCSAADSDCSVGCINSLFSKLEAQKGKWEVV